MQRLFKKYVIIGKFSRPSNFTNVQLPLDVYSYSILMSGKEGWSDHITAPL